MNGLRTRWRRGEWAWNNPSSVPSKFNTSLDGLPEKDATLIRFGRALFQEHKVDSVCTRGVVDLFGKQGVIECAITLSDYAMAGFC
jgi:hypothetical protein